MNAVGTSEGAARVRLADFLRDYWAEAGFELSAVSCWVVLGRASPIAPVMCPRVRAPSVVSLAPPRAPRARCPLGRINSLWARVNSFGRACVGRGGFLPRPLFVTRSQKCEDGGRECGAVRAGRARRRRPTR